MLSGLARLLAILVVSGIFLADASAQQVARGKPAPLKRIEPGLRGSRSVGMEGYSVG